MSDTEETNTPPKGNAKVMVRVSKNQAAETDVDSSAKRLAMQAPTVNRLDAVGYGGGQITQTETVPLLDAVTEPVAGAVPSVSRSNYRRTSVGSGKNMLQVMPLAILLPSIGDLSKLYEFGPIVKARLKGLYALDEADLADEQKERASEEGMLSQVEQWLMKTSGGEDV